MHKNKGKKRTPDQIKLLSDAHKGLHSSVKTEFKKGKTPWNKGKGGTYKVKHPKQFKKGRIPWNKGKPHLVREKNPNWKGGITPLVLQIRHHFKYRQWVSDIFMRDDYTCQMCLERGGNLEADHYPKPFSIIFKENDIKTLEEALDCEEFWSINNGRTLCVSCHNKTKYGRKKN